MAKKKEKKKKKCWVCNEELTGKRTKKCEDCEPFWNKAQAIIDDPKRKPVLFDLTQKDKNVAGFAKEMRTNWEDRGPYYLCKYTWLPMLLEVPKPKDEKEKEKKKEEREFLSYLVFSPDRIDSKKNYEPGNIEVCSYLGNIMKNALSKDAFDSVITGIIESKVSIGRDKQLAKMLKTILEDFYADTKLSREGILELLEAEKTKDEEGK